MTVENRENIISLQSRLYKKNARIADSEEISDEDQYKEILDKITQIITDNHSSELAKGLYLKSTENRLRNLINKYLVSEKLVMNATSIGDLTTRIYDDMAGIGFIRKYLEDPDVEEININGKDVIWVTYGEKKVLIPEKYATTEDCINTVKKMARLGGVILDASTPHGDSFLAKGIRMNAAIYPSVGEECGAVASIRKQKASIVTKENLIEWKTATEEELEFLSLCINNGVSIGIGGSTGSGKTADMNYLLNQIKDPKTRIVTMEDTKELMLDVADHVQFYTKEPPNEITLEALVKLSLRQHPDIIVPAEMRGAEAVDVIEAARTGHTALSSFHTQTAKAAYYRLLTMYRKGDATLSEGLVLSMIIEAFPIILIKKQLKDSSRKYIEIFEATGVKDGDVEGTTLFKFVPTRTERDKDGKIVKIHGHHQRVGNLSKSLAERLILNGADIDIVKKYAGEEFESYD